MNEVISIIFFLIGGFIALVFFGLPLVMISIILVIVLAILFRK